MQNKGQGEDGEAKWVKGEKRNKRLGHPELEQAGFGKGGWTRSYSDLKHYLKELRFPLGGQSFTRSHGYFPVPAAAIRGADAGDGTRANLRFLRRKAKGAKENPNWQRQGDTGSHLPSFNGCFATIPSNGSSATIIPACPRVPEELCSAGHTCCGCASPAGRDARRPLLLYNCPGGRAMFWRSVWPGLHEDHRTKPRSRAALFMAINTYGIVCRY
jgi:hypothetical protein